MQPEFSKPRFTSARLTGTRFAGHTLPVDVLRDFAAYEELVVDVAKHLYLQEHPEKKRAPNGFSANFRLDIEKIEKGSVIIQLVQGMMGLLSLQGGGLDYFERARDLVAQCVAAADRILPENFPLKLLKYFNRFGRSLQEDEALELPLPEQDGVARLTQEKRQKLVLAADVVYEDEISVMGSIEAADFGKENFSAASVNNASFRFRLKDGGTVTSVLPEACHQIIRDYNGRHRHHLHIKGIGNFDARRRLQKIVVIDYLELFENVVLANRFDEIAQIEHNWFEGQGLAPDADALANIAEKMIAEYPESVPLPWIVPTQDGNLLLEWKAEGEPTLDIDLHTLQASFHAFDMDGEDIEGDFPLNEEGWKKLFVFLKQKIRMQQV